MDNSAKVAKNNLDRFWDKWEDLTWKDALNSFWLELAFEPSSNPITTVLSIGYHFYSKHYFNTELSRAYERSTNMVAIKKESPIRAYPTTSLVMPRMKK